MKREVIAYKHYFKDFISQLTSAERKKVGYVLDMLRTQQRVSTKFVKAIQDELYELRVEYNSNIYRLFFIFDNGNVVVLFNGFQKKTQKTPKNEIEKALKLKEEYYGTKRNK